jgi:hypothetical protein
MAGSLGFPLTRSAQVERHRAMRRRAFTKTVPSGSEISPGMTVLLIWLLAAEKNEAPGWPRSGLAMGWWCESRWGSKIASQTRW